MCHIGHYRVLPWATGLLTLLESIAKVPVGQVVKTGKSAVKSGQLENTETRERKRERKQPKDVENVSQFRGRTLAKSLR